MPEGKEAQINLTEKFSHLPDAPIVEAIIDLRCKPESQWDEKSVRSALEPQMAGYAFLDSQKESQIKLQVTRGQPLQQEFLDLGWKGLRFRSTDGRNIAQFNRDGFIFRRLPPYEDWEKFQAEALRLWVLHLSLAKPSQIQRIGLRYVNRIPLLPENKNVSDYISGAPLCPSGLGGTFHGFIHRDTWAFPPYAINVVRAFQVPSAIILDLDVYSPDPFELETGTLEFKLSQMRWLKNKAFFGIITAKLQERLQDSK